MREPNYYHATDHQIDHDQIDPDALYVVSKLQNAGYIAYIVGGGVRDLVRQRHPKDFDISTSALPNEVKRVFGRRCLLIGKRFRLAHIRFGHKVIEVSTFRSGDADDTLITQDNVWGDPEEDVLRRDFTINGLFYDPFTHSIIDYIGGWDDLKNHTLNAIGDPATRYRQDPVRMIRLLKFRARFDFAVEKETEEAIITCREEIMKSAPARILEEVMRMLESGAALPFFQLLRHYGFLKLIFPPLDAFWDVDEARKIEHLLHNADQMQRQDQRAPLHRSILTSCLLFPIIEKEIEHQYLRHEITPHLGEITLLTHQVIREVVTASFTHFPRRISAIMSYILSSQYRFHPFSKKTHYSPRIFRNKDFPLALYFLKIRTLSNQELLPIYTTWKEHYRKYLQQHEHHAKHNPPPRRRAHP